MCTATGLLRLYPQGHFVLSDTIMPLDSMAIWERGWGNRWLTREADVPLNLDLELWQPMFGLTWAALSRYEGPLFHAVKAIA